MVRNVGFVMSVLIYTKMKDFYGTLFSYKTVLVNSFPLVATCWESYYHCHSRVPLFCSSIGCNYFLARNACFWKQKLSFFSSPLWCNRYNVWFIPVPLTIRHSAKKQNTSHQMGSGDATDGCCWEVMDLLREHKTHIWSRTRPKWQGSGLKATVGPPCHY